MIYNYLLNEIGREASFEGLTLVASNCRKYSECQVLEIVQGIRVGSKMEDQKLYIAILDQLFYSRVGFAFDLTLPQKRNFQRFKKINLEST